MQTAPTGGLANLILDLDVGNMRMSAARDPGVSPSQPARSKAGNSSTPAPERRSADGEAPRQTSTAAEGAAVARQPDSHVRTSDATTKKPVSPAAPARPRITVAAGETPAKNKQAVAANATSAACGGAVFAAVLQQATQTHAAKSAAGAALAATPSKTIVAPVKGAQKPSQAPSTAQGQAIIAEKVAAAGQAKPVQQSPQKTSDVAAGQTPLRTVKETKPSQARSGADAQLVSTGDAKPLAAAVKAETPIVHPAVAATVSPQQAQQHAAVKATAPDSDKMTEVYKAGEKPSGRREPVKDPTQAAKLNQARVTTGQTPANAVAAESTGPAQILASATQQAAGQVSSGTPAKAGEVALQGTARGATQAEISQQAADVPVADQIVRSIRAADARIGQQITVQLTPPELGKVRITLRSSGQQIRGVMEADNPDTLRRLEREAAGLTQRLSDAGLEVRRLDVVLARQDGQATSENPLPRDGSGQHPAAQSEPAEHAATTRMESPEETTVAGTDTAVPGSINVRI